MGEGYVWFIFIFLGIRRLRVITDCLIRQSMREQQQQMDIVDWFLFFDGKVWLRSCLVRCIRRFVLGLCCSVPVSCTCCKVRYLRTASWASLVWYICIASIVHGPLFCCCTQENQPLTDWQKKTPSPFRKCTLT